MEYINNNNRELGEGCEPFIAHVRKDGTQQPLIDHLKGTAIIAKRLATKIGLPLSGELISREMLTLISTYQKMLF